MKFVSLGLLSAATLAGLVFWSSSQAEMTSNPYKDNPSITAGKAVYEAHCAACHRDKLQGQANWQIRSAEGYLPAPPHDETGHTWHHPDELLYNMTKYGFEEMLGKKYPNNMPVYEDILSDGELLAVLGYIKSTWPEKIKAIHDKINQSYASNKNS